MNGLIYLIGLIVVVLFILSLCRDSRHYSLRPLPGYGWRSRQCRAMSRRHGELLKLGIDIGQTSAAKYMARRRRPPSQGWSTFLRNHADGIAAMDLFVVPTISFRLLRSCGMTGAGFCG